MRSVQSTAHFLRTTARKTDVPKEETNMKQNIRSMVSGMLIGSMLTGGITLAKTESETLEAWFSDIKIMINGTEIQPKDANGNRVEPFIVNGTTYLPVRAIGEALQKEVRWDGTTNTVFLTDVTLPDNPLVATPAPTPTEAPNPTQAPVAMPSEFSYTTYEILQISGYQKEAIKGEVALAWDATQKNASFSAKMRCNNGGLGDYIDCEITLVETTSTQQNGFTGAFKVIMNEAVKYETIKGTVTVENNQLSLHTEEYDYRLLAALKNTEPNTQKQSPVFYGLNAKNYNGEQATGLLGFEISPDQSALTVSGNFTVDGKQYTLKLNKLISITDKQIEGIFSILCNGEILVNEVTATLSDLTSSLGETVTFDMEGFVTLQLQLAEIAR